MRITPYIIGIAGASGSGKTTFAERLYKFLLPEGVNILSFDDYYMEDCSSVVVPNPHIHKADVPQAVELNLLKKHLETLIVGKHIERPIYDFEMNSRLRETVRVYPTRFLIVEGVYAFCQKEITALFQTKVFVSLTLEECLTRRLERDVRQRGRSPEGVITRFNESIIPTYQMYVLPFKKLANVTISGKSDSDKSIEAVMNHVDTIRKQHFISQLDPE